MSLGILVHGDNHFIVRGPQPGLDVAMALARHWSIIEIGRNIPLELAAWSVVNRAFREDLEWACIVPGDGAMNGAVHHLLDELRGRGIAVVQQSPV